MNDRGTYGSVKTFGQGMLAGGITVIVAALMVRHAMHAQKSYVTEINAYRPRSR